MWKIHEVLTEWEGTPYLPGQRIKGRGTDCVGFLCGVMDEMYGFIPEEDLPPAGEVSIANALGFHNRYPSDMVFPPYHFQAGDVVLCGREGIGHCYIAYNDKTLFHADGFKVCRVPVNRLSRWSKVVVLRPRKEDWNNG